MLVIAALLLCHHLSLAYIHFNRCSHNAYISNGSKSQLYMLMQKEYQYSYLKSLVDGQFVKLICGASNQDVALIRNLCYLYTVSGVDCIDICIDPAVISAARLGIEAAISDYDMYNKPLLMVSVNDDEDPHFRKAQFDIKTCPATCPRPCERVCPAEAIPAISAPRQNSLGVVEDKCYGCGRCINICPYGYIEAKSYIVDKGLINIALSGESPIDAIEIHTLPGHENKFKELWNQISESVLNKVKILAVSFPDMNDQTWSYLNTLQRIISSNDGDYMKFQGVQIWQADGRPMSGDIGKGTTHATYKLGEKILNRCFEDSSVVTPHSIDFRSNKHFIQLAGGANDYSPIVAKSLLHRQGFGGFGFGGYARKLVQKQLLDLELLESGALIEKHPKVLELCLLAARSLVSKVKLTS